MHHPVRAGTAEVRIAGEGIIGATSEATAYSFYIGAIALVQEVFKRLIGSIQTKAT